MQARGRRAGGMACGGAVSGRSGVTCHPWSPNKTTAVLFARPLASSCANTRPTCTRCCTGVLHGVGTRPTRARTHARAQVLHGMINEKEHSALWAGGGQADERVGRRRRGRRAAPHPTSPDRPCARHSRRMPGAPAARSRPAAPRTATARPAQRRRRVAKRQSRKRDCRLATPTAE